MKKVICSVCNEPDKPMDDTIKIEGHIFCVSCFDKHFSDESKLEGKLIEKDHDPTICCQCLKDFGDKELDMISIYPVCEDCKIEIKNKTFPTWVKAFLAAVVLITITGFIWNWKYYTAYKNLDHLNEVVEAGDMSAAAALMTETSELVPQVEDFKALAAYYRGIEFLNQDESEKALLEFNICRVQLPEDFGAESLWQQAKIGVCFDNQDYNGFLKACMTLLESNEGQPLMLTAVASAYACLFVDEGTEIYKDQAEAYLENAKMIDDSTEEMKNYYDRVEHRIQSKTIITSEEFEKKFPNGWTKK
jgi:hypothetical protein